MNRIMAAAIVLAAAASTASAQAKQEDIIKKKDGTEIKCKISKMTMGGIIYAELGGKTANIKNEEVDSVILWDTPPALTRANNEAATKNFTKAYNLYDAALTEVLGGKVRDLNKPLVFFNWAMAQNADGKLTDALATMRRIRTECGDTRMRNDSFRESVKMARKDESALIAILDEMKSEPDPIGGEAKLELGRMKYAKADYEAAVQLFNQLAMNATASYANDARMWQLRCLRRQKKDEAQANAERYLSDKTCPANLLQAAGAAMADACWRKTEKDKTKVRDAAVAAARAIAMGPPATKDDAEDYAIAVIISARCYGAMSDAATVAETKNDYRERAVKYCTEVVRVYKGTAWADEAQEVLTALGGGK